MSKQYQRQRNERYLRSGGELYRTCRTDNCPAPLTIQLVGLPSGGTFPVGVTTNTFRVTDGSGNTATCSFTVTVVDAENPVLVTANCNSSNAAATAYNDGWQTGDNDGAGFGAWTLNASTGNTSQAGFFVATSTANGAGTDTNADGDINSSGRALGMYANSGQNTEAIRNISGSFAVGSTLNVEYDNGFIDNGQTTGFQVMNSAGQILSEVRFLEVKRPINCWMPAGQQILQVSRSRMRVWPYL
ncbi:MAG: HYR domain-containing protein [Bacteroidetes bacterium]|nr:HYR domain-containing protein [Bacteroidota bacterium]